MLVEDDNNLREIYEARLSAEGYEIVSAPNGEAALAIASKEHPDMIISDVMMPKISGFEMLDILRNTESLRDVKIIMLTALGQAEDSQRADSLGADRYLVKSQVTLEDIVRTAHELLNDVDSSSIPADMAAPADADTGKDVSSSSTPSAPAAEPAAAPAQEPSVPPAPILDTMPAAPQSTDTAPTAPNDSTTVPVATEPPVAPAPLDDSTAPADQPATEPPAAPAAAPSVISIPVVDGSASQDASVTTDTSQAVGSDAATSPVSDETAASNSIGVVEPPAEDPTSVGTSESSSEAGTAAPDIITLPDAEGESQPAPTATEDKGADDIAPNQDYTSPENFNTVQTEGVTAVPEVNTQFVESVSQDTASEEAAMKAQIDSFISSPETVAGTPAEEPETSDSAMSYAPLESEPADSTAADSPTEPAASAPDSAPEEQVQTPPSVEIPSIISSPIDTTESIAPVTTGSAEGENIVEPQPETLDDFQAPIISAPSESTQTSVTEEESRPETVQPESIPDNTAAAYDDKLVQDAAENLTTAGSPDEVAPEPPADAPKPQSTSRMKIVSPISSNADKPSIHQLLELEEAKNAAQQAAGSTQPAAPNVEAYRAATPNTPPVNKPPIDPNSISL